MVASYSRFHGLARTRDTEAIHPRHLKGTTMQANRFAAAVLAVSAAAFGGAALAESPNAVPDAPFVSTKSRDAVQAELAQYKQAGVNPWSTSYNPLRGFRSTTSRDQVTAAYIASRDEVAALTGEDSGAAFLSAQGSTRVLDTTLAGQPSQGALR